MQLCMCLCGSKNSAKHFLHDSDRDVAMGLLEANHDPIEAILVYNKPKRAKARLVPPPTPVKLQHPNIRASRALYLWPSW